MPIDNIFAATTPAVPVRGVHLDLKGSPPTFERLLGLLELFAACRYNAVLVEWEDTFPWTVDTRFRCETAYTPGQVAEFHAAAAQAGLQVIPLVQCLGHMETPLAVPGYEHLREEPHDAGVLNPLAEGAGELVAAMVRDMLDASPGITHFHLGGDEAWSFGRHPDTKAYIEAHGKGALYLRHVEPICDELLARGVRPILWHDMMCEWDADALAHLAGKADLCVWGYHERPDTTDGHHSTKIIQRFADHNVPMWGGTAFKGASGHNVDLANLPRHEENATGWADAACQFGFKGVFATAWSRYNTHNVQCEMIDASLDSLVNVGVILHDGAAPAGGADACQAALADVGEGERFQACRAAAARLSGTRDEGWRCVRQLREVLVMATIDARRRSARNLTDGLEMVRHSLIRIENSASQVRDAFAGLVEPIWIDRYLAERIEPIREEYAALTPRVATLNPVGYRAQFGPKD